VPETALLAALFFAAATLYSSVGHAGASGYLAMMALVGMSPEVMKPTALLLNIIVASIATVRFYRAGFFSWAIFWPFALSSIPFAALGGALSVPTPLYSVIVGMILLLAAYRLFFYAETAAATRRPVPRLSGIAWGAGIGFVSGLTGIGGGILLSPLLLLAGWADVRRSAGVAAAFVLVNSLAGIVGHVAAVGSVPRAIALWAVAAAMGGVVGSELGVRQLAEVTLRRLLAVVLAIAGLKLIIARR
jgi:uncharacterized membrane protein YfcA